MVQALANMSRSEEHRREIVEEEGITPMVQMLMTGTKVAKQQVARTLGMIASDDGKGVIISHDGGIPSLIDLLANGNELSQEHAALALAR